MITILIETGSTVMFIVNIWYFYLYPLGLAPYVCVWICIDSIFLNYRIGVIV